MNSFDRFAFHNAVGDTRAVKTESEGFGLLRRLGVFVTER
jgi:predicted RNA-binding protein Jag